MRFPSLACRSTYATVSVGGCGGAFGPVARLPGVPAYRPVFVPIRGRFGWRWLAAEEARGERAASEEHLVEGRGDVGVCHDEVGPFFRGKERGAAEQFLNEGGAHAFGAVDDR